MDDATLIERARNFVYRFEDVFRDDWDMTRDSIGEEWAVPPDGTFIDPGVEDEYANWVNRGALLEAYRALNAYLLLHEPGETDSSSNGWHGIE